MLTLADDSGLEVDALGGAPGVRSHRFSGPQGSDASNNELLMERLAGVPPEARTARYRCVLALVVPRVAEAIPNEHVTEGTMEGRIAMRPAGSGGFGYDPIFEPESEPVGGRTVGQLSAEEKNRSSHRAIAARAMAEVLRSL
jgi:XTP/dITP diphosphohydrolase